MRPFRPCCLTAAIVVSSGCGGGTTQPAPPPPPPPPAVSLDLQPGEMRVLTDASEMAAFAIVGAAEAREYEVILMSASRVEGAMTSMRLKAQAAGAAAGVAPAEPGRAAGAAAAPRIGGRTPSRGDLGRRATRPGHAAMLERMREEIRRVRPRISPRALARASASAASVVPTVGQTITLKSSNMPGGAISCLDYHLVDGVVKAVGERFVLLEDVAVAGYLTDQDYAEIDAELDAYVAPVDQDYFGDPPDIDGNGRVIAFITGEVNLGGDAIGFFNPLDMFDPADCASSNEGEILWLNGPDPDGTIGDPVTAEDVKGGARGLIAHEYHHLLNNFQRFLGGGAGSDDVWIEEGLAHLASEVSGLYRVGAETRAALGFTEIGVGTVEGPAFYDFHEANLGNVGVYLEAPNDAPSLATFDDPDYTDAMRGWGYLFLRWLGDRYGPASPESIVGGSGEHLLFRELTAGGPSRMTGIPNILRAIQAVSGASPTWDDLLAEYFAAPAVVDAQTAPAEVAFRTWDFDRLYAEMAANAVPGLSFGYPLQRTDVLMGAGAGRTVTFDLGASTARYFRFTAPGAHPDMRIELTLASGTAIPSGPRARAIIVRTR